MPQPRPSARAENVLAANLIQVSHFAAVQRNRKGSGDVFHRYLKSKGVTLTTLSTADTALASLDSQHSLLCFSHLRWQFVFQRPQHLMSRFARTRRTIFWEEPESAIAGAEPALGVRTCAETGVVVVTPSLPEGLGEEQQEEALRILLDEFLAS
jgi:hypothetical protein